jgi:copper(I)-binding protein
VEKARWLWLLFLLAACADKQTDSLAVHDAWVREPPGGHPIAAAYMRLENTTDQALVLVGTESAVVERVEIHEMKHQDGKMSMRQVERIEIPAKSSVVLKPSGLHLMLIGMEQAPQVGESVELTLHLEGGAKKTIQAIVRRGSYAD